MIFREFRLASKHVDPWDQDHPDERKPQSSAIAPTVSGAYFWGASRTTRVRMANGKPADHAKAPDQLCPEQSHVGGFAPIYYVHHRDFVHLAASRPRFTDGRCSRR